MLAIDNVTGCILGQCLGDALGFPVEGMPGPICAFYVNDELRTGKVGLRMRGGLGFGQYTDDSQLMREMLQSYVEFGELRMEERRLRKGDVASSRAIEERRPLDKVWDTAAYRG
jgi:ADP-ribosylglycohydrolase